MSFVYSVNDTIGIITLNNPPGNHISIPMLNSLNEFEEFLLQPSLTGAIIQGAGGNFCEGVTASNEQLLRIELYEKLILILSQATVPTIAVIQGKCLDAGFELACCCHFRFAAIDAELALNGTTDHTMLQSLMIPILSKSDTRSQLISLLLSGTRICGSEAVRLGIIDVAAAAEVLKDRAQHYLQTLTCNRPPHLVRAVMNAIGNSYRYPINKALAEESMLFDMLVRNNRAHSKELEKYENR